MSATRNGQSQSGRTSRLAGWVALAVGAVALVVIVVIVATGGSDEPDTASDAEGVAHVHGLGVDPADGTLHVATHHGLFELSEDGAAQRISKDRHDFMGFTVVGADHFLASGHPSPEAARELEQPLFGLIESTDGGVTWTPKSLSGATDFHALEAAHGNVYGFDATSSRFLVSADGIDWEARSETPIADLAVHPDDADRIVASSSQGLIESVDGGRTWKRLSGAPPVVFLDWHAERGLWGLDGQGQLHHLEGDTWQESEALEGAPHALLVHDSGVIAAVDDGSTVIHRSEDGQDWNVLYRDQSKS